MHSCRRRSRVRMPCSALPPLAFALSVALIPTLGMDLIPSLAQGRFEMTVKQPPGTALIDTDKLVAELQQKNAKDPNIALIYGVSGTGTRLDANPTESGENIARLLIVLKPGVGERGEGRCDRSVARVDGDARRHRSEVRASAAFQFRHAAGNRTARLRPGFAGKGRQETDLADECFAAFRRHEVDGRRRLSRDPDPFRPGTRCRARPDDEAGLRPGREQGARFGRDALQLPRSQDRRAGARAGRPARLASTTSAI